MCVLWSVGGGWDTGTSDLKNILRIFVLHCIDRLAPSTLKE